MSNRTIYKYPLYNKTSLINFNESFTIKMPKEAEVLCVQMQNNFPQIWVIVDPNKEEEERRFNIVGTGWTHQPLPKSRYVGTFQDFQFVWHLFETE